MAEEKKETKKASVPKTKKAQSTNDDVTTITLDAKAMETFVKPVATFLSVLVFSIGFAYGLANINITINGDIPALAVNNTGNGQGGTNTDNAEAPVPTLPTPTTTSVSIDDDPFLGNIDTARVAIVEFTDLECPFCQRHSQQTKSQIVENYVDTGDAIYVSRDFVLSFHDPAATQGANAAECVHELSGNNNETYFNYLETYFANTGTNGRGVGGDEVLADFAADLGIDRNAFLECQTERRFAGEVQTDQDEGTIAGITGTPGFVVGVLSSDGIVEGQLVSGAQPFTAFQAAIEEALSNS